MLVKDFIQIIYDGVGTQQDYLKKSVDPIFTDERICRQLNFALNKYASFTKALEAYHSLPVAGEEASIMLPNYMLRSEGVRFLVWFINGYAYPLNDKNLNNTYGNFPVAIQGLPRWFNIWQDRINFYPQNSNGFNHTTITSLISATLETIPVASTAGFTAKNGRFTIDNEIIQYGYKDATNFYECRRGMEDTIAVNHSSGTILNENNVWVYYYRLHFPIETNNSGVIPVETLNKEMLICDEHLEIIADYTIFKLLSKIDTQRAQFYKINFDDWLKQAKRAINNGRAIVTKGSSVRSPYIFETNEPLWSSF